MTAGRSLIKEWLIEGQNLGASHMILVCDENENEEYPEYVHLEHGESVHQKQQSINDNPMLIVIGIYDLRLDLDTQLDELITMHTK